MLLLVLNIIYCQSIMVQVLLITLFIVQRVSELAQLALYYQFQYDYWDYLSQFTMKGFTSDI